ncbi:MAG: hypothetical protein KDI36_13975 [Pseudomonadales bacterium]|nr:hypothetical protein [Pseudomonadales bacterium]
MKPHARIHWEEDDLELEQEFAPVSTQWQHLQPAAPQADPAIERRIRQLARVRHASKLERNWIFGDLPRLTVVMLLFFSIGLGYLLFHGESKPEGASVLTMSADVTWQADSEGRAYNIVISGRCLTSGASTGCTEPGVTQQLQMDELLRKQVREMRQEPGAHHGRLSVTE